MAIAQLLKDIKKCVSSLAGENNTLEKLVETLLEKQCEALDKQCMLLDIYQNCDCPEKLEAPLVKGANSFTVAAPAEGETGNNYSVGTTVSLTDASGNPQGTAVISGAGVPIEGDLIRYPVTDCSVSTQNAAQVTQVKPVLQLAAQAVKNVAVKYARAIKEEPVKEEPVREEPVREESVPTRQ